MRWNLNVRNAIIEGRRGFSLIEMVLVIVVIGLVSALAVPLTGGIVSRSKLMGAVDNMLDVLEYAKTRGRANPALHCGVHCIAGTGRYIVFDDTDRNGVFNTGDAVKKNGSLQATVTFNNDSLPSAAIIFRSDGVAVSAGTILVKLKNNQRKVNVTPAGHIRRME
jgi:prepilin-type N-terminal cleavage/methylation domain-containing protein